MKKAALYDPYLDVLGGGEKHILSILKVLEDKGFEINIFWDKNLNNEIKERFNLGFKHINFFPNIFKTKGNFLKRLFILNNFDLFFYIPNGSYFFSSAKKNLIFSMVPKKEMYPLGFINKLRTWNYQFITNSQFTQEWLKNWGMSSQVIYPFLDNRFIDLEIKNLKKDKIILTVGRFFKHLHAKRQDIMIDLFKMIKQKQTLFKDFKLILAGGLKQEDNRYFEGLRKIIGDDSSIVLKPNISYQELFDLYKKSLIYWHFTGFGIDEKKHPELVEHLGIAPLEAMASGCLTFCFNAGGPKKLIKDGQNGFLFNNKKELIKKTVSMLENNRLQEEVKNNAKCFSLKNFSYHVFKQRVKKVILNL